MSESTVLILNGTRVRLKAVDLDGDGVTGEIETVSATISHDTNVIEGKIEGAELIKELNKDEFESGLNFSSIDKFTRLHIFQVPAFIAWDASLGKVIPYKWSVLTRKASRYFISLDGLGRKENVDLIGGKTDTAAKVGGSKIADYFKKLTGGDKDTDNNSK